MRRWWCAGLIAAMTAALIVVAARVPADAADASAESAFVARINSFRESKGLAPLQVDSELVGVVRNWTDQMADADQISHNPNLASEVGEDWIKLGENVGVGNSVDDLMQAFIDSPSHYRVLTDPDFRYVGVGVTYSSSGRMFTTHDFMALNEQPAASAPAPVAAPARDEAPPSAAPPPPPSLPPTPPATAERVSTMLAALRRVDL